jgi:hypothetical protein
MFLQFAVRWSGGRWILLAPVARYDRYLSRQSALDAAHRLADQARRYHVRVLVQDVGGELLEHRRATALISRRTAPRNAAAAGSSAPCPWRCGADRPRR